MHLHFRTRLRGFVILLIWIVSSAAFAQSEPTVALISNGYPPTLPGLQPNQFFLQLIKSFNTRSNSTLVMGTVDTVGIDVALAQMNRGKLQMLWGNSSPLLTRDYAFALLAQAPFISAERYVEWRKNTATRLVVDELFARYKLKTIQCAMVDSNIDFALYKAPDEDFRLRNAKIAAAGPHRELYESLGLIQMAVPFSRMQEVMKAGLIDGVQVWTAHDSLAIGLQDETHAIYFPSKVRTSFPIELMISLAYWDNLTNKDRFALESTCEAMVQATLFQSRKNATFAVEKYVSSSASFLQLTNSEVDSVRLSWAQLARIKSTESTTFKVLYQSLYVP